MAGLIDAAVDAAAHVLDKGAEDPTVQIGHDEFSIDEDIGFQHNDAPGAGGALRAGRPGRPRQPLTPAESMTDSVTRFWKRR